MDKKSVKDFTIEELKRKMAGMSAPSYRAGQIFFWVYKKGICSFSSMANIPKPLRDTLSEAYYISDIGLKQHLRSSDGTEKFLFELSDKNFIETVLIYSKMRKTLCISTQVGCKYGCVFCASGARGFIRNLSASEILDQILYPQHVLGHRMTNFVFMGMGEPLDNYENVSKAIVIMNSPEGLGIGARRITISTCGIVPGIEKLKKARLQINLSVSLHTTNNKLRDALVPVNKRYPLEKVIAACKDFEEKIGTRITLEYVLIRGKNDSIEDEDALTLSHIAKKLKAKVNLIACSPVEGKGFEAPSKKDTEAFKEILLKNRVNTVVRESKGKDIQAACGQLAAIPNEMSKAMSKASPWT
jgi:23S rRNA (adenine2503-C2)-methyltransferase